MVRPLGRFGFYQSELPWSTFSTNHSMKLYVLPLKNPEHQVAKGKDVLLHRFASFVRGKRPLGV